MRHNGVRSEYALTNEDGLLSNTPPKVSVLTRMSSFANFVAKNLVKFKIPDLLIEYPIGFSITIPFFF